MSSQSSASSGRPPNRMTTSNESVEALKQHKKPCHDCPFARTAIKGWLGTDTVEQWLEHARTDTEVPCHVIRNQQCAGIAIFRRNMCKLVYPPLLTLPVDRTTVFSSPLEFSAHHTLKGLRHRKKA